MEGWGDCETLRLWDWGKRNALGIGSWEFSFKNSHLPIPNLLSHYSLLLTSHFLLPTFSSRAVTCMLGIPLASLAGCSKRQRVSFVLADSLTLVVLAVALTGIEPVFQP